MGKKTSLKANPDFSLYIYGRGTDAYKHSWGSGNLDRCHQVSDSIRRGFDSR